MSDNYFLRLNSISLENFRVFKERQNFDLAPITILVGPNGSGKSSFLKFLELLSWNAKENSSFPETLKAGIHEIDLSTFDYISGWDSNSKELKFSLKFDINAKSDLDKGTLYSFFGASVLQFTYRVVSKDKANLDELSLVINDDVKWLEIKNENVEEDRKFTVTFNPVLYRVLLDEIIGHQDKIELFEDLFETKKEEWEKDLPHLGEIQNENDNEDFNALYIAYETLDLLWHAQVQKSDVTSFKNSLERLLDELKKKKESISYTLSGVYFHPDSILLKIYIKDQLDLFLWKKCSHLMLSVLNHFKNDYNKIDAERTKLKRFFQRNDSDYLSKMVFKSTLELKKSDRWIKFFEVGESIKIKSTNDDFHRRVIINKRGKQIDICDLGYGYYQLIPLILVLALFDSPLGNDPKHWMISEPESNLHPKLQSKLSDLYSLMFLEEMSRFIIETHSEYLIRKLQYLVANSYSNARKKHLPRLKVEDVAIYYFHEPDKIPEGRKQVYKIEIEKNGRLSENFGEGFFDVSGELELLLYNSSN